MKKLGHGCTLDCADCCRFNVYVEEDKIIKIEGDKEHPYTKGFICKKGLSHLERLNHKKRIYTPLIKKEGKWHEITFEESIEIIADKINKYKKQYGSRSILYYEQYGNGAILKSIGNIFVNFLGGVSKSKGGPCWSAGIAAQKTDFGDVRSHSLEDMMNSKNIFVWGKNPASTTIHTMQAIRKAKNNGSKVIVIDPIKTDTAKLADKYVKIKANGDLYLALAMAKIIIESNLHDEEYIKEYVNGFIEYKEYLSTLELKELSYMCGVEIDEIYKLVNLYIEKFSTILLGFGMQKYKNGGETIRVIDSLGAITGQIGYSGGGVNYANKVYTSILDTDPYNSEGIGNNRYFYTSHISDFILKCNEGKTYYKNNIFTNKELDEENTTLNIPIKMAMITKSNLLNQLPNLNTLNEVFNNIDFKVCFDMFLTDTAEKCDLFIPTTNTLESEDLLYSSMMNPYLTYNEKIVEPKNMLMDEYFYFMELAKRLKLEGYPFITKKEYLERVIEPLKNIEKQISLDYIKNNYFTLHKKVAWENKGFLTSSGRFELISCIELKDGKDETGRLLRLLTNHGRDSLSSQNYMDEKGLAVAYINKDEAGKNNIYNDKVVTLKSRVGSIKVKITINESISNGVIMMYVGWWNKHGNPNYLTESTISNIGGQVTYNETFVQIIQE